MTIGAILGIVLGCLVLVVVIFVAWWFWAVYQSIINKRNNAEDSFGELNSLLKGRYEDVSAFVEAVGGACDEEIKEQMLSARNLAMASASIPEQLKNEAKLETAIERALLVYQEKKQEISPKNQEICDILYKNQEFINKSRQFYNSMVKTYNEKLTTRVGKFWVKARKFQPMAMYNLQ